MMKHPLFNSKTMLIIAPTQQTAEWMLNDYDLEQFDVLICYSPITGQQLISESIEQNHPFDIVLSYH